MKIRVMSDIHLEIFPFWPTEGHQDLVVLAGDIGMGCEGILWARKIWPTQEILFVPGNHEFYHMGDIHLTMKKMADACDSEGVHGLIYPGDYKLIGDKMFMGGTLWTNFSYWFDKKRSMELSARGLNDYFLIKDDLSTTGIFTPQSGVRLNNQFLDKMERLYDMYEGNFNKDVVVVTHMAPSGRSSEARFHDDPVTGAYANMLEPWIEARPNIKLWIHGHMHNPSDYKVGENCWVVANPRGYASGKTQENKSFDPELIIEI